MGKTQMNWSRRSFLATLGGAGAALLIKPFPGWAAGETDPRVAEIVARTIGIDGHNHVDVPLIKSELPGLKIDLAEQMKTSGLSVICMTFAVDYQRLTEEGQAWERFRNGLTAMDEALKQNHLKRAFSVADIEKAHGSKKPIVIQSVEGGHFLEGKIERLEIAYQRGLRHFGLLHDNDASVPLGDIYTNAPKWGGLTAFGSDVVRECERLGILVDLTHCDDNTINMVLKQATKPVIISHTGLLTRLGKNEAFANMMKPRLISEKQAKIVAEAGGLIGVWTHLADTPLAYAENIRAMVDVVGIDHVSIGTDTKITSPYRSPADHGPGPDGGDAKSGDKGKSQSGKVQKQEPQKGQQPGGTNHIWPDQTQGFYYTLVDALLKAGFHEYEISKIGGGNYLRVFDAATKAHQ